MAGFSEEEGMLGDARCIVKISAIPRCSCAVVGCRGWAYRGEYREDLHRHLDAIGNAIAELDTTGLRQITASN